MKLTVLVAVLLGTVACAAIDRMGMRETHQRERIFETVPTCMEGPDCKAQWEAAQRWILQNLRWKIQSANDVYIETFGPSDEAATAMRVVKEPVGGGKFRIEANTRCGNMIGCFPDPADSLLNFNRYVTSFAVNTTAPEEREKLTATTRSEETSAAPADPLAPGTELFTAEGNLLGKVEMTNPDAILVGLKGGGTLKMSRTQATELLKKNSK